MDLQWLTNAMREDAAIRRIRRLQPAGGPGDKIFPPTYPGEGRNPAPRHVFEVRRIAGADLPCVLIDSVQSQANRMEEALLAAATHEGMFDLPRLEVDFAQSEATGVGKITSLDAPHRVFDAIIRDAEWKGTAFPKSEIGIELTSATMRSAQAMFKYSPTSLVFGAWNSTGEGGGLGAKFPRCVVSEIVGVNVQKGARVGSRIDPLGIVRSVEVYKGENGWAFHPKDAGAKAKKVRPSEINHGNIAPSVQEGLGVTIDYAQHTAVVTLAGLRRLSFGEAKPERDVAGRAALAALALLAIAEQDRQGYALRSRCDLVLDPAAPSTFQLIKASGKEEAFDLDAKDAVALLGQAVEAARKHGLPWDGEPVKLMPSKRLAQLVTESRRKALEGKGETAEGNN